MDTNEIWEVWKPIAGVEAYYEVSNMGRVRSLDRVTERTAADGRVLALQPIPGRVLKRNNGLVILRPPGEAAQTFRTAVLVLEAFKGVRVPTGARIEHIDGDKTNCRADNLRIKKPKRPSRAKADMARVRPTPDERFARAMAGRRFEDIRNPNADRGAPWQGRPARLRVQPLGSDRGNLWAERG